MNFTPRFRRVIWRLVWWPAMYRGDRSTNCLRDATLRRLSHNFCWIVNEKLDDTNDWGLLARPLIGRTWKSSHKYGYTP